ncbi:MAG: hypothetical protein IJZ56_03280 [Oscillospiraceae bacterium]|nr:hypothetical protein [Oscillospiraceae bacterium]
MSEEIKKNETTVENPAPEETEMPEAQEPVALSVAVPTAVTMWNDAKKMNQAFKMARFLSTSAFVPDQYRNAPENCIIAIDIANRMGIAPLMVMQSLYVVKGKPSWSGSFCAAAINGSGRFTPLEYVFVGKQGESSWGCFAAAVRVSNGVRCYSDTITMAMAAAEGWLNKPGSKWKTMPMQMMMYRAAAFFARAHCSDILLGLPTYEEVQDVKGYADENQTTVVTLEKRGGEVKP